MYLQREMCFKILIFNFTFWFLLCIIDSSPLQLVKNAEIQGNLMFINTNNKNESELVYLSVGGNTSLDCTASGDPPPTEILWNVDGTPIENELFTSYPQFWAKLSHDHSVLMLGDTKTKIMPASCLVLNENRNVMMKRFTVISESIRDLQITDGPKNTTKTVSEKFETKCEYNRPSDDDINVTIEWYYSRSGPVDPVKGPSEKQAVETLATERKKSVSVLEIEIKTENQTGWYTCGVISKEKAVYKSAFLKVEPKKDVVHSQTHETGNQIDVTSSLVGVILVAVGVVLVVVGVLLVVVGVLFRKKYYDKPKENRLIAINPTPPSFLPRIVVRKDVDSDTEELKSRIIVEIDLYGAPENYVEEKRNPRYEFPIDEVWDISRGNIELFAGEPLGEGYFGTVQKAMVRGIIGSDTFTMAAVKTLKEEHNQKAAILNFVLEVETMKVIGSHENIINLLGCCVDNGTLMVILEYAVKGNLLSILRRKDVVEIGDYVRLGNNLTEIDLLRYALQIAEGMEYLASKKCIHRDLAARNILVTENDVMKVSDFGLARNVHGKDYYRASSNFNLPFRWMSPEALCEQRVTTQSDVWSFGITLYEMMTEGAKPYDELFDKEVIEQVLAPNNFRMDQPKLCSKETYQLMRDCWETLPEERPTFSKIKKQLTELIRKRNM